MAPADGEGDAAKAGGAKEDAANAQIPDKVGCREKEPSPHRHRLPTCPHDGGKRDCLCTTFGATGVQRGHLWVWCSKGMEPLLQGVQHLGMYAC